MMEDPKSKWKIVHSSRYKGTYQFAEDPEMIHILRTGFHGRYLIVWEDAYELVMGKTEVLTKKEIKDKFNIDLE
mgnify:FL=1